jgi:hypothetical protein
VGRKLFQSDAILHFLEHGGGGPSKGGQGAEGASRCDPASVSRSSGSWKGEGDEGLEVQGGGKPKVQDSMVSLLKQQRDALASEVWMHRTLSRKLVKEYGEVVMEDIARDLEAAFNAHASTEEINEVLSMSSKVLTFNSPASVRGVSGEVNSRCKRQEGGEQGGPGEAAGRRAGLEDVRGSEGNPGYGAAVQAQGSGNSLWNQEEALARMDTILSSLLLTSSQLDECLEKGHSLEAAASARGMRQRDDGGSGREEGPGGTGGEGQFRSPLSRSRRSVSPGGHGKPVKQEAAAGPLPLWGYTKVRPTSQVGAGLLPSTISSRGLIIEVLDQVQGQQMSPMVNPARGRTRSPLPSSLGQNNMAENSRQQSPQPHVTKCAAEAAFSWAQIAKDHLARRRNSVLDAAREPSREQAFGRVASPKSPANRSVDRGMQNAEEAGQGGGGGVGGGSLFVRTSYADVSCEEAKQRRSRWSISPASRSAQRHWAPSAVAQTRDSPTSRPSLKGNSSSPLGSRIRRRRGGRNGGGDDGGGGGAQRNGPGGGLAGRRGETYIGVLTPFTPLRRCDIGINASHNVSEGLISRSSPQSLQERGKQGEAEDLSSEELQAAIRRWQRQESLSRAAMPLSTRCAPSSTTTHATSPRTRPNPASSQLPPQRWAEQAPAQAGTPTMTAAVVAAQERWDISESSISRKASSGFSFDGTDGHESSSSPDSRAAPSAPLSRFRPQTKQATSSVEAKERGGGGGGGEGGEGGGAERRRGSGEGFLASDIGKKPRLSSSLTRSQSGDRVPSHVSAAALPNTPLPLSLLSLFRATLSAHAASAEAPLFLGDINQSGYTGSAPPGKSCIYIYIYSVCICVCVCVCVCRAEPDVQCAERVRMRARAMGGRGGGGEGGGKKSACLCASQCVCLCVCVFVCVFIFQSICLYLHIQRSRARRSRRKKRRCAP